MSKVTSVHGSSSMRRTSTELTVPRKPIAAASSSSGSDSCRTVVALTQPRAASRQAATSLRSLLMAIPALLTQPRPPPRHRQLPRAGLGYQLRLVRLQIPLLQVHSILDH